MARNRAARPEARPLRLFAAVDIPPRAVRAVDVAVAPWRARLPRAKWVPPENWHVTVKFMGRTYPRLVPWVHDALREAAARIRPFRVSLRGLGVFPGTSRARVFWVGLADRDSGLEALARSVQEAMAREFPPEKRPFTAHLTVARFNPPVPMREHAEALAAARVEPTPFRVGSLTLYRSHLGRPSARYEPLEGFPLRG
ncbi:MAG TPA: RNA 2',3'-cyclic phosphodiesterase [Actinomycetota bacterium]|nr:RNA 2',3'-cyclic phosphodiesterase [Actinomycetota bacterium]